MLKKYRDGRCVGMLAQAPASADWLFTPNIGVGFGGIASGREYLTYSASSGWMGAGVLGWQAEFAYTRNFSDLFLVFVFSGIQFIVSGERRFHRLDGPPC